MPLWIDLKFVTIIVYYLDSLFNNFCRDLLDILEIINYISITVFLCFTCNMLSPVPECIFIQTEAIYSQSGNFVCILPPACF